MKGMCKKTGKSLDGISHLKQSIADILSTPIGSRVMRRNYGSALFDKIDKPLNGDLVAEIYKDIVSALYEYEPRFEVRKVSVVSQNRGSVVIDLEGRIIANGKFIKLEGVEIRG